MNKEEKSQNLIEFFRGYVGHPYISFHMPGHKGEEIFRRFGYGDLIDKLTEIDVTEIPGADNLFQPEDSILSIMDAYAELYGVRKSFLSVGGSSNGLMAAIMSVCKTGDNIAIARNSHKSVYNGVELAGAKRVYLYPEIIPGWNIAGPITPKEVERIFREQSPKAVVIPSPNYYGVLSDVKAIAEICHDNGAALIVDQAHGAHLKFMEEGADSPKGFGASENLGADIVVNSIHKTLASFTQTAVVNVCTERINTDILASKLEMIESSSPSYMLMLSLNMNAEILKAQSGNLMKEWQENLDYFYREAKKISGLKVLEGKVFLADEETDLHAAEEIDAEGFFMDMSKILLDMTSLGVSGNELFGALLKRGICLELADSRLAMAMTGVGNTRGDYEELLKALGEIAEESEVGYGSHSGSEEGGANRKEESSGEKKGFWELLKKDREIAPLENEKGEISEYYWEDAVGKVSAANLIPYPPGIPLVVKGEVMDLESLEFCFRLKARGAKVVGMMKDGKISAF